MPRSVSSSHLSPLTRLDSHYLQVLFTVGLRGSEAPADFDEFGIA